MKKKVILGFAITIGVFVSILLLWIIMFWFRGGEIKRDIFHPFSYVVYEDHVELTKYLGEQKEVELPERLWGRPVTVIGEHCFYQEDIEMITIPNSVESIGVLAFGSCKSLKKIEGGKNVRFIGDAAFNNCKQLEMIGELGTNVKMIRMQGFYNCEMLKQFPFDKGVSYIDNYAFYNTAIQVIDLSAQDIILGIEVFEETPWMKQQTKDFVVLNDILISYQGNEEVVYIPEGIKGVAYYFEKSPNVREVYIPTTAEYISGYYYSVDNVEKIWIPEEVEDIGSVFWYTEGNIIKKGVCNICDEEQITIVTTAGSPAEAYAKEFGIPYEIVEGW